MPITIDGAGTIGGLNAGGLPDATVQTADLVDASVTPTKLSQPMTLMTAQNATGTSIEFTGIPAWARRITVMFNGVSTNGTARIQIQIGSGAIDTTNYLGSVSSASADAAVNTTGFYVAATVAAARANYGLATLTLFSANTWCMNSVLGADVAATTSVSQSGGAKALAGTLDRIRIIASATAAPADTFDAGSINVMYEG